MFTWRKKPDGFEWHEYIRTTILVRRKARRQKVVDARRAAGEQMQAAGVALAAGSCAAGGAAWQGALAGIGGLALGLQGAWAFLVHVIKTIMRPIADLVARPHIGGPLALVGAGALGAGIGRTRVVGLDEEGAITLLVGAVLTASLLPMLARAITWRPPRLPRVVRTAMLAVTALAALIGGAAWVTSGPGSGVLASALGSLPSAFGSLPSALGSLPVIGGKSAKGRAYAAGADTLRVGSTLVRLAGVEAHESEQRCGRGTNRWRCSGVAETVLARLVNSRTVSCSLSGSDDAGRALGRCTVGQTDVAAELVRQGYVFAESGILARYAGEEREARAAKAGLWGGDAERPAEFRAKLWEEAKRRAPDGCPIKGQVTASSRVYVLPWSADYERARVQTTRGERWFCSEQEAVAAGFKAAQRG
jgi:endonuclease YncB( thermonuclease family)